MVVEDLIELLRTLPQTATLVRKMRHGPTVDRMLDRLVTEIVDGLRHGYFEFRVTCEVIGQERRRLILRAGKLPVCDPRERVCRAVP
jgi:hypothetical protein